MPRRPVHGDGRVGVVAGQDPGGQDDADGTQEQVDQEDRPPGQPGEVGVDDEPGQNRATDRGDAQQRTEQVERRTSHVGREVAGDDRHALGDEERTEGALQDPGGDHHAGSSGQPTGRRGEGEAAHADQEEAALSVAVAEASADDEQDTHGQGVGRSEPFDQAVAAADVAHDRGRRDVGDGRVDHVERVGEQDQEQDGPHRELAQPCRSRRRPGFRGDGHDDSKTEQYGIYDSD